MPAGNEFRCRLVNRVLILEISQWAVPDDDPLWRGDTYDYPDWLNPAQGYFVVVDARGSVLALGATGEDARVRGGDYSFGAPRIVDVALWPRPSIRASSNNAALLDQIHGDAWDWLAETYGPRFLRTTCRDDDTTRGERLEAGRFERQWAFRAPSPRAGRTSNDEAVGFQQWIRRVGD